MDEHGLTIQVCKSQEELRDAADAEMVILEGLGRNILKNIGSEELGRPIKIFVRNNVNEVVGGLIANVFGVGFTYRSCGWKNRCEIWLWVSINAPLRGGSDEDGMSIRPS